MTEITVPRSALYRAQARLAQAEAIVEAFASMYNRIAGLLCRAPAARGDDALMIRRAWLRAGA
jgi:hypothetical protein